MPFDSTNAITLDIDTFSDQIEWSYDLESLPLNYLLVNGEKIKTTVCQAQKEWLNCLKSDPIEFNLEKCKSNYQVNLSYGFDGFDEYINDNQFKPKFVTKTINLQCNFSLIIFSFTHILLLFIFSSSFPKKICKKEILIFPGHFSLTL